MLCTLVVSIASLKVSGGKIVGIRFAIIDFPDPGGPMQREGSAPGSAKMKTEKGTGHYNRREGGAPGSAKIARVHYTEPMDDPK